MTREEELKGYIDTLVKVTTDAWKALGYKEYDVPGISLADAIRKRMNELKEKASA